MVIWISREWKWGSDNEAAWIFRFCVYIYIYRYCQNVVSKLGWLNYSPFFNFSILIQLSFIFTIRTHFFFQMNNSIDFDNWIQLVLQRKRKKMNGNLEMRLSGVNGSFRGHVAVWGYVIASMATNLWQKITNGPLSSRFLYSDSWNFIFDRFSDMSITRKAVLMWQRFRFPISPDKLQDIIISFSFSNKYFLLKIEYCIFRSKISTLPLTLFSMSLPIEEIDIINWLNFFYYT